jgi:hypothetical protein
LSVTVTEALLAPVVVGVKVTLIVQEPAAATVVPQLLVCAKSPGFVPEMAMLEMVSVPEPGLDSVIVFAALVVLFT